MWLFHRHALGEVAWLVHVAAARDGDVIREQLQRHGGQDRIQRLQRRGQKDHVVGDFPDLFVALGRQRDDRPLPRPDHRQVRHCLVIHRIPRQDEHGRRLRVNERNRPVLHFRRRITLGMDVGNFLQLERALERDRKRVTASEEEEIARLGVFFCQLFQRVALRENGFQLFRNGFERAENFQRAVRREQPHPSQMNGQQRQNGQCRDKRFC